MALRPDYGTRLKKDGHDSPHVEHFFYGLPISGFDALGRPGQYSLTVDTMYAGERHCLSLDFGPAPLAAILAALPAHIRQSIEIQMSRDPNTPRQFKFPHPVHCESVAATLGELQHGHQESFVPLNIWELKVQKDDGQPAQQGRRIEPSRPELLRRGTQREMGCRHQLYLDGTGLAVPGRHARPLLPARHRLGRGRSHDQRPAAQGA